MNMQERPLKIGERQRGHVVDMCNEANVPVKFGAQW